VARRERQAEKATDMSSVYYLEWQSTLDYWHSHCLTARKQNIFSIEGIVRAQTRDGISTPTFDGMGRAVWLMDLHAIRDCGDPDDPQAVEFAKTLGGYPDFPYAHDEQGRRIQATKVEQIPASLRAKVLAGLLPQTAESRCHPPSVPNMLGGPCNATTTPASRILRIST
jgi:hypothetical protein